MDRTEKKPKLIPKKKITTEEDQGKTKKNPERTNTGVTINRDLWRQLKAQAILQGKTAADLIDQAIEQYLKNLKGGDNVKYFSLF